MPVESQNLTGKTKRKRRKIKIGGIATHSKCQIHIDEIGLEEPGRK
jgi:hypothetical protein